MIFFATTAINRGVHEPTLFTVINDNRIRATFTITNDALHREFVATALIDGGDTGELTLPAKKIVELGLQHDSIRQTLGAHGSGRKYKFKPPVTLSLTFKRPDGSVETRETSAYAHCNAVDYDFFEQSLREEGKFVKDTVSVGEMGAQMTMVKFSGENEDASPHNNEIEPFLATTEGVLHASEDEATTHLTPLKSHSSHTVAILKLSPTEHRPADLKNQVVRIGAETLSKLNVLADFAKKTLEIEEDESYDELN
jgi:hypothetical protein